MKNLIDTLITIEIRLTTSLQNKCELYVSEQRNRTSNVSPKSKNGINKGHFWFTSGWGRRAAKRKKDKLYLEKRKASTKRSWLTWLMYVVVLFRTFAFVLCQKNVTRFVTERSAVPHHILVHSIGPSMLYQQVKYKALVFTKTDHWQVLIAPEKLTSFPSAC